MTRPDFYTNDEISAGKYEAAMYDPRDGWLPRDEYDEAAEAGL